MKYAMQLICLLALLGCDDVQRVSLGGPPRAIDQAGRGAEAGHEAEDDTEHSDQEGIDRDEHDGADR